MLCNIIKINKEKKVSDHHHNTVPCRITVEKTKDLYEIVFRKLVIIFE